jgi:hypothetical protein
MSDGRYVGPRAAWGVILLASVAINSPFPSQLGQYQGNRGRQAGGFRLKVYTIIILDTTYIIYYLL